MNNTATEKTKVIIYDFDGTIADTFSATIDIYNRIAQEKGFESITNENIEEIRSGKPTEIMKALGVKMHQLPALAIRVRKELKKIIATITIKPGLKEVILSLKKEGYIQGIVTSNSEESVREFLKNNAIDSFEFVHGGSSVFGKARTLKKIIKSRGYIPGETIYIGDEVRDIDAAREAGIKIISVGWGFSNKKALKMGNPDAFIERPEDLASALATLSKREEGKADFYKV